MKKIFYLLFIALVASSCIVEGKGEKGDPGAPGASYTKLVLDFTVEEADWKRTTNASGNNYFYFTFNDVSEINPEIFNKGAVIGYVIFPTDDNSESQHQLPYVRHCEEYNESTRSYDYYTETVDYAYGSGWVEFQFRASDFKYETNTTYTPKKHYFRIVILY